MKKTLRLIGLFLMTILICVNFSSCSNDDEKEENSSNYNEMILGTWVQDDWGFLTFEKGGTLSFVSDDNERNGYGTWSISGKNLTYTLTETTSISSTTSSFEGTIQELTETTLVLIDTSGGRSTFYRRK